jgi:protein-disulfide isomerase
VNSAATGRAPASQAPPIPLPTHATPNGDGLGIGVGLVVVDVYLDFQCPSCKQFVLMTARTLEGLVAEQKIRWVDHPMNMLDVVSTTAYSTRATAASASADDYGWYPEYAEALMINQPEEGGPGLSDEELVDLGHSVGITDEGFAEAVHAGRYLPWPTWVTECATRRGVSGIPTVYVDGRPVAARPGPIVMAVRAAGA